ncbi:MAG: hypothetical protein ABI806_22510 [Candidatus Solibacter sp.]
MMGRLIVFAFTAMAALAQQPRIDQLQNNYSYLLPNDPSYGIAQGSIFIIKGANLAPSSTGLQNVPLAVALNGVSARVTVNGSSSDVLWYYVTPGQLGGILPSRTPVGNGSITVTTAAGTSAPAPIKVVQSAIGLLTLSGSGSGAAAVLDTKYAFLSAQNAARPGDYIQLFGSGVGPTSGDESILQVQADLTSIAVTATVGGLPATVVYRGRTVYPGLDQINIIVPNGVTPGCAVPLTLRTGAYASNEVTIPVADSSGTCPAPPPSGGGTQITAAEIESWIAAGQFRTGSVGLTRQTSYVIGDTPGGDSIIRSDVLSAGFNRIGGADLAKLLRTQTPPPEAGACIFNEGSPVNPYPNLTYTSLDAGASVSVSGAPGSRNAPRSRNSVGQIGYATTIGTGDAGNYIDPGRYTLSGPGGLDVGSFSGSIDVAPELTWTNRAGLTTVNRTQPITLTWSGGEPSTLVTIQGVSTVSQGSTVSVTSFQCFARNTDRQFTVPVAVLSRMLASPRITAGTVSILLRGSLAIASVGTGTRLQATGIDYLTAGNQWGVAQTTEYK